MEIFKTLLMGCGALTLLSAVGCAGLVGVGSYAVDQSLRDEDGNHVLLDNPDFDNLSNDLGSSASNDDPFNDYQPKTYDDDGNQVGGWGDEAQ